MVRLSIDEAIANERAKAEMYRFRIINRLMTMLEIEECEREIEEHKQLAEWLEELKDHRERECNHINEALYDKGYSEGYNKAIDDFAERLSEYLNVENATKYGNENAEQQRNSYDTLMKYEIADAIDDIAEQLKAGGEN